MDTAGALLGPLVAFVILRQAAEGYDAVFTVSTCVAVTGVLVLRLFVPGRPASRDTAPAESRASLRTALALLGRRDLRRLAICALLLGLATVSRLIAVDTDEDVVGRPRARSAVPPSPAYASKSAAKVP